MDSVEFYKYIFKLVEMIFAENHMCFDEQVAGRLTFELIQRLVFKLENESQRYWVYLNIEITNIFNRSTGSLQTTFSNQIW